VKRINKEWYQNNKDTIDEYRADSKGFDRIERND